MTRLNDLRFAATPSIAVPLAISAVALAFCVPASHAQVIPDRTTLNSQLVTASTEDFEAYNIADGNAVLSFVAGGFDSSTVYFGQGPGLVNSDISFLDAADGYQWNGKGYYGQPSRDFLGNSKTLTVNSLGSVDAFGVDLLSFAGFPSTVGVTVYDGGGNVVYATSGLAVPDATDVNGYVIPTFFGYQSAGGIGKVSFYDETYSWTPLIDNVTYGTTGVSAVPEPGVVAFGVIAGGALLSLIRRKRKA